MIIMPLIDEAEALLDEGLMSLLESNFTTRNGLILDLNGNAWLRWRADGLDAWWRLFEEAIDAPMGRRLANSACDEEEWLLNSQEIDKSGFFRRKKSSKSLIQRWRIRGWGEPSINPPSIAGIGLTPVFAGLLQAAIERIDSKRYRMRWEEKTSESCILTLDKSTYPVAPTHQSCESYSSGTPSRIEVESEWRIDGQRYHLLPAGLFKRLQDSCAGLIANISEDERAAWPVIDDGFLSLAIACKNLYIAGEEIFLASDANGWKESCNAHFAPRGISTPLSVKSMDDNGGIELFFKEVPIPSITVGFLAGAWTRCEGRPVKVGMKIDSSGVNITLQSRYELA